MKKAISISLSIVEADNRVIRQCDALVDAGFKVTAFGLHNTETRQSHFRFTIVHVNNPSRKSTQDQTQGNSLKSSAMTILKKELPNHLNRNNNLASQMILKCIYALNSIVTPFISRFLKLNNKVPTLIQLLRCRLDIPKSWEPLYWGHPIYGQFLKKIEKESLQDLDLIVANDWRMLPVAMALYQKYGIKYIYDSHEHAISQYNHLFTFRTLHSYFIHQLERDCIKHAEIVMAVSSGILEAIKKQYTISVKLIEIKSTPYYSAQPLNIVNKNHIKIYYHGYLKENRHLQTILESLKFLDEKYSLVFRGGHESSKNYEYKLKEIAKNINVSSRFSIEPMASHSDVYQLANEYDIGLCILPLNSVHTDKALPNKFFEYIMSGLALGVSDLSEMRDSIIKHNIGFVVQNITPEAIANSISKLSISEINEFKKNSIELAKEFCWENERLKLIEGVQSLFKTN